MAPDFSRIMAALTKLAAKHHVERDSSSGAVNVESGIEQEPSIRMPYLRQTDGESSKMSTVTRRSTGWRWRVFCVLRVTQSTGICVVTLCGHRPQSRRAVHSRLVKE